MKPKVCQVIPLPDQQVAFEINGRERLRWHAGPNYPRPFFYPAIGPSGHPLTRMGHPGAPNHDHHRSIWFAHRKVLGIDFWSENTDARIRQLDWLAYIDGDAEAVMAVRLGWFDGHDPSPLLTQELVVGVRPLENDEWTLELQSTFVPTSETLEFQKTNFGFLAVRVAKSVSAHFGEGVLTNSSKKVNEQAIFGQQATWVDYSGPVGQGLGSSVEMPIDGITYMSHVQNAEGPCRWHVREDGWMGASACFDEPIITRKAKPLRLRYLLHLHRGPIDHSKANALSKQFDDQPMFEVSKSKAKHQQFAVTRRA